MSPANALVMASALTMFLFGWSAAEVVTPRWASQCVVLSNSLLCYGGEQDDHHVSSTLYSLNLFDSWNTTDPPWKEIPSTQDVTLPLSFSAAALLPDGKRFLITGGKSDIATKDDTHQVIVYDTQQGEWSVPTLKGLPRIHRQRHTATSDNQGRVWIWGGKSKWDEYDGTPIYENSWVIIDTNTWVCSKPSALNPPLPRVDHTATLMPDGNNVIIIGGSVYSRNATDPEGQRILNPVSMSQLLLFDMSTGQWKNVTAGGNVPAPRRGHTTALSWDKRRIILFGGATIDDELTLLNDVFVLELDTMRWSSPSVSGTPPMPRQYHQARLVNSSMLVLFGLGQDGKGKSDVNILDTEAWTWMPSYISSRDLPNESELDTNASHSDASGLEQNKASDGILSMSATSARSPADMSPTVAPAARNSSGRGTHSSSGKGKQTAEDEEPGARVTSGVIAGMISAGVVVLGGGIFLFASIIIYRRRKQSRRASIESWEKSSEGDMSPISSPVILFPVSHKPNETASIHATQITDEQHKPDANDIPKPNPWR